MKDFEKTDNLYIHVSYYYEEIETYANHNNYHIHDVGIGDTIGKSVIILDHDSKDSNLVLVMVAANGVGMPIYNLAYTDEE